MMQFHKQRDFGSFISDTFNFFKIYGKNYFKNYFIVNGLVMIIMIVVILLFYRNIFGQILGSNLRGESYYFERYFQENAPMLIISGIVVFVLLLIGMLISYSFPVLYLRRISNQPDQNVTSDHIFGDLKKIVPKFLKFFLGMLFIIVPAAFVVFALGGFLMMILIGFFILILVMPIFINVVNFTLFDYYHTNRGYFSSLSYAFRSQFSYSNSAQGSPFWKYWGSTVITFLIYYIIATVFSVIPMVILITSMYTVPPDQMQDASFMTGALGLLFFVIYGVSILASMILVNLVYVNSGLQYYDSRTDLHRQIDINQIETIGKAEA